MLISTVSRILTIHKAALPAVRGLSPCTIGATMKGDLCYRISIVEAGIVFDKRK
jgi:hypothetical protein